MAPWLQSLNRKSFGALPKHASLPSSITPRRRSKPKKSARHSVGELPLGTTTSGEPNPVVQSYTSTAAADINQHANMAAQVKAAKSSSRRASGHNEAPGNPPIMGADGYGARHVLDTSDAERGRTTHEAGDADHLEELECHMEENDHNKDDLCNPDEDEEGTYLTVGHSISLVGSHIYTGVHQVVSSVYDVVSSSFASPDVTQDDDSFLLPTSLQDETAAKQGSKQGSRKNVSRILDMARPDSKQVSKNVSRQPSKESARQSIEEAAGHRGSHTTPNVTEDHDSFLDHDGMENAARQGSKQGSRKNVSRILDMARRGSATGLKNVSRQPSKESARQSSKESAGYRGSQKKQDDLVSISESTSANSFGDGSLNTQMRSLHGNGAMTSDPNACSNNFPRSVCETSDTSYECSEAGIQFGTRQTTVPNIPKDEEQTLQEMQVQLNRCIVRVCEFRSATNAVSTEDFVPVCKDLESLAGRALECAVTRAYPGAMEMYEEINEVINQLGEIVKASSQTRPTPTFTDKVQTLQNNPMSRQPSLFLCFQCLSAPTRNDSVLKKTASSTFQDPEVLT